jgi:SNF2 family DNA or RNA helicase
VAYIRIDGSTLGHDRQLAVQDFKFKEKIRVAVVGVTAGGVGLDFSAAQTVVFVELPQSLADLMQVGFRWGVCVLPQLFRL